MCRQRTPRLFKLLFDSSISAISVSISSGSDTLADVRDAINAATTLVTASLVKNGDNYKLMLSPTDSGTAKSLSVSVTDSGDSNNTDNAGLSQLAFNSSASNLTQVRAGSDAAFDQWYVTDLFQQHLNRRH